jgi:hypothetical protein
MKEHNSTVIFDLDDFSIDSDGNAMNHLIEMKAIYPNFKVTLFTILGRWMDLDILKQIAKFDWIELAAHGYEHFTNGEVLEWDKKRWYDVLNMYEEVGVFSPIFKAPNWEMSKLGYEVLKDMGWGVAIRQSQLNEVPEGMKYYSFEGNPFGVHGHTWTIPAHREEGLFYNWCEGTRFEFVSSSLEIK